MLGSWCCGLWRKNLSRPLIEGSTLAVQNIVCDWDVARFARERLEFEPDATQSLVMNGRIQRGLLNCTRQWGKSTVTAIMAVHRAYFCEGSLTVAVSPSGRQSGEFVSKAKSFALRLGLKTRGDGHNEMSLLFPNRS